MATGTTQTVIRCFIAKAQTAKANRSMAPILGVTELWVLDDHRIVGTAVMPGTAYLEMARAAVEKHGRQGTLEIRGAGDAAGQPLAGFSEQELEKIAMQLEETDELNESVE
jgi:Polyketide synthase dehydratase